MASHPFFLVSAACVVCATYWAFSPGLSGPFLFDDYATLPQLGSHGGVHDWQALLQFVIGGHTGPGGRPLTLLSFLANARDWPAQPEAFKITNLALHIITGGLLYALVLKLSPVRSRADHEAALITAAFWLLNPFNVSTTLYVVQRMAMLSALFSLAGLLCYVHGRSMISSRAGAAYRWMTSGLLLFTPLAMLSKENGALLPLLALVVEYTVLRHHLRLPAPRRWWTVLCLIVPSLLVITLILRHAGVDAYATRSFDLAQRLLTEGRVLFDYLYHWFNPFATTRGLFAEDYPVSMDLLTPWTTIPAILGITAMVSWAIWTRRRYSLASLAILFFFAGHLMESTVLPLEIYYEHRNYLPAVFLALPVAAWLPEFGRRWGTSRLLIVVILCAQAWSTHRLASIWGNEPRLANWWANNNPGSGRAQDFFASSLTNVGRPDLAASVMETAMRRDPGNSHFHLHHLLAKCRAGQLTREDKEQFKFQLASHPLKDKSYPLLARLVEQTPTVGCNNVDARYVLDLLNIMMADATLKSDANRSSQLQHLRGELYVKMNDIEAAIEAFDQSLSVRPDIGVGMQQVALLANHDAYAPALNWLARVERLPKPVDGWGRARSPDYDSEIRRIRGALKNDLDRTTAAVDSIR